MEMSHRSKVFIQIFEETQAKLRRLMKVPDNYKILFLQTGATGQFSMIPLNLIGKTGRADYAVTGNFSNLAYKEAQKYGQISLAASSEDRNHTYIPSQDQLKLDPEASYFYYCANNTVYGTEWQYVPETGSVPLVCDMSSDILSRPVDVSKFGIIYAGAQKNMAPAGLTVVIIREDLAGHELPYTPVMMSYKAMIDKDSMYNTPPCWCIYMLGLMCDWLEQQGGAAGMEKINQKKAQMLYDVLDNACLGGPVQGDVVHPRPGPGDAQQLGGEVIVVELGRTHQNGVLVLHGVADLEPVVQLGQADLGDLIHRLNMVHNDSISFLNLPKN